MQEIPTVITDAVMMAQVKGGAGFVAALDQSGGSTPKALKAYGVAEDAWSNDEEMFDLIHQMRVRIITTPSFSKGKVLGAILFERTMDGMADGVPVPTLLRQKGIVPFLKMDKGLEAEQDGVQLMKPIPGLDVLLERARSLGVFGTKMRSVVRLGNRAGIAAIVKQQFEVAEQILNHGLMPIVEPEVLIASEERSQADAILREELLKALDALEGDRQVILKLSIPHEPDFHAPLIAHPRVIRVIALSGGYSRTDACAELAKNHGVIASFSRALIADLAHGQSDEAFDAALAQAIDEIYIASIVKA